MSNSVALATTHGIQVTVESIYVKAHSDPEEPRFVFAYNVTIKNEGTEPAQLTTRHWIITDAKGHVEEVRGPGIVGETPRLEPGQEHAYQSFCVLKTPRGTMGGSYQMVRDGGAAFDAEIPLFALSTGEADSRMSLN